MASGRLSKESTSTNIFARQFPTLFRRKHSSVHSSMSSSEPLSKDNDSNSKETPKHPKSPRKHSSLLSVFSKDNKKISERDFGKPTNGHSTDDAVSNLSSSSSLLDKPNFRRSQSESADLNSRVVRFGNDVLETSSSKLVTINEDLKPHNVVTEEKKNAKTLFDEVDKEVSMIPLLPLKANILINQEFSNSIAKTSSPRQYGSPRSPTPLAGSAEIPTMQSINDQLSNERAVEAFNALSASLVNVQETMKQMNNQMLLMQQNQILLQKRLLHQDQATAETNKQLGHIMSLSDHVLGVQDSTLRWTSRLQTPSYPPPGAPQPNQTFGQSESPFGNSISSSSNNNNNVSTSSSNFPPLPNIPNSVGLRRFPSPPAGGCAPTPGCTIQ
jgi:hypothetical protein